MISDFGDERASGVAVLPAGHAPTRERAPGVATLPAVHAPAPGRAPLVPGRSGAQVAAPRSMPSRPARSPARPARASGPGWWVQLVVLIAGVFMSILDTSIVNVAMPVIRKDFGVTLENVQWISTAYNLSEGVVVPISAWLGARFGLKRVYVSCLALFTLASALCGTAGGLGSLIFFRVVQAIPGGILPVIAVTILYRIVPTEKLGTAMGLYGLGAVVAPGIGPTLGGYLIEHFSWPVIFYINVPIGVLAAIAAAVLLRGFPGQADRPFDLPGFASIALAMFALLLALEEGPTWGWTSYPILILFAAAVNLLALFVVVELQVAHPMLDVRVFTRWPFVNSLLLISAMSLGMNAVLFYVPAFLQNIQGLSAWHTGLVLLPQAVIMMVLMPVSGRLYDRFGARWPAIIGLSLTGGGILLLSRINVDIPRPELIAALVVMFAGLALGMMPVMTGGLSALPAQATDTGSALNTLTQRVSAALGLAVLTALVNADQAQFFADRASLLPATGANIPPEITRMRHSGPAGLIPLWRQLTSEVTAQAYSTAFFLTGCVTLAGIVLAVLLRTPRPTPGATKPIAH